VILAGEQRAGKPGYPWLVFLHGFSGDAREWRAVGEQLGDYPQLYLDLPGHGGSTGISVSGFHEVSQLLTTTLISYNILSYWLVGYSLGGRIAMFHACQQPTGLRGVVVEGGHPGLQDGRIAMFHACQQPTGLRGVVVEGGHPGLQDAHARDARLDSDRRWAKRLRTEPLGTVFADWYQQPVFASLTQAQRSELITLRSQNSGAALADMLEATSLAVQPDLRSAFAANPVPFYYLYGERDEKFGGIAAELNAVRHAIPHAGHNAHRENPAAVAATLAQILRLPTKDTL
jgi:2-succinyl-6-hydroxy-2,4-cyclohexadiene-1-carboxylate synthase